MKPLSSFLSLFQTIRWHLLSFPLFFKIVGVGVLTAFLFGWTTLYLVRGNSRAMHYPLLEQKNNSVALSLASHLELLMLTNAWFEIHNLLQKEKIAYPDIQYIIVSDQNGRVMAHTFDHAVPRDLQEALPTGRIRVWSSAQGLILESSAPLSGGNAGFVRIGVSDNDLEKEGSALTQAVLISLGTSAVFGICLALLLTSLITRPVRHLSLATEEIRQGRFGTQAPIFSGDEIGKLTEAFNQMSDDLKRTNAQVQEKETARLILVRQAVATQEEERKRISRELHDDFGQSLSALLLSIQAAAHGTVPVTSIIFP
jgi:signal transduction histidine kinase